MNWLTEPAPRRVEPWNIPARPLTAEPTRDTMAEEIPPHVALEAEVAELREEILRMRSEHELALTGVKDAAYRETERSVALLAIAERELRDLSGVWTDNVRDNVLAISVAVARRIIGDLAESDPIVLQTIADQAIARLGPVDEPPVIRLNPEDIALHEDRLRGRLNGFRFIADERVVRGGCVVEAGQRLVDADIERSLASLYREVRRA